MLAGLLLVSIAPRRAPNERRDPQGRVRRPGAHRRARGRHDVLALGRPAISRLARTTPSRASPSSRSSAASSTPPTARCWPRTGSGRWTARRSTSAAIRRETASNIVGYSTQARSRAGLERSLNDYLTGSNGSLRTVLGSKLDALTGRTIVGNSVVLTIDPDLQRVAQRALAGNCGAAVAPSLRRAACWRWRRRPAMTRTRSSGTSGASRDGRRRAPRPRDF